jgi:hypothetical protein
MYQSSLALKKEASREDVLKLRELIHHHTGLFVKLLLAEDREDVAHDGWLQLSLD